MQTNIYGKTFLSLVSNNNLNILNGRTVGDLTGKITCIAPNGVSVVDYIATSHTMKSLITSFKVLPFTCFSDHKPLSLSLSATTLHLFTRDFSNYKPAPTRFLFGADSGKTFTLTQRQENYRLQLDNLKNEINNYTSTGNRPDIIDFNNKFTKYINDMASSSMKSSKTINDDKTKAKKNKNNPWFNHKCRLAKRDLNKAARITSKFPSNDYIRSNYYRVKKTYKSFVRKQRNKYFDKMNKDIENGKVIKENRLLEQIGRVRSVELDNDKNIVEC